VSTGSFRYEGYEIDSGRRRLLCHYSLGSYHFVEETVFEGDGNWSGPAVDATARLVFLLAGVSYYKTLAPAVIDLGTTALTEREERLLTHFYRDGLGEFAYRNGLDLSGLELRCERAPQRRAADYHPLTGHPLVPFGGGIDSIVTAEEVHTRFPAARLFVVSAGGSRFDAIEGAARRTGMPVVRANRTIDPQLLRAGPLGFRLGHVPITGIISAVAAMAAVLGGHDAVVMSNEWSASIGSVEVDGRTVNHQYSKSDEFERSFRDALADAIGAGLAYFSLLRPYTELRVAARFAALSEYHPVFHSCNRAFATDPTRRLERWCGTCDKCCFIDLILAPFVPAESLREIFAGHEPLERAELADQFRALLGTGATKPFECVGDVGECRAALALAAARADRASTALLQSLAAETPAPSAAEIERLLAPVGDHAIPHAYATDDLLV
jgi:UDP-N-acetyl-alpha-D-muramoyl-L-alanyl-L-glutamate epimerase